MGAVLLAGAGALLGIAGGITLAYILLSAGITTLGTGKDVGLFDALARKLGVPLELSPLLVKVFEDGRERYGYREFSPNVIRRLEEATGLDVRAPGFPAEIVDNEPEAPGYEVVPER